MDKPVATETPPVTPTDDETFASAFSEAVGADVPPESGAPAAAAPEPAPEPAAEPPPESDTEPEPAVEPEVPPPDQPAAEGEEPPEARIARLEAENAALRAPKPPPAATTPAAPEITPQAPEGASKGPVQPPIAPPEPVWYQPTDDEKTILTDLEKNWPDIASAQQVAIKQAVYNAVQYTFNQIQKSYNPTLQRFAELSDVMAEQLALSALRGEHNDYDEVYDKVVAWVETLPFAFKAGAKHVMAQGTPDEVAELITEYKKSHSAAAPNATATPAVPAARKTELSAAAKQAASRLRVVGSKRTTPVVAADPNDFNAAWDEAISQ
jgi:hypothetical protein